MRSELPEHHGLSDIVQASLKLLPRIDNEPSLTDIQFDALDAGVARGESVLISAPTSTGKTLIGLWTIASALAKGGRAVYLVSHRALAKQKFGEIADLFLDNFLDNDSSSIVCATGDGIEDASGRKTSVPLSAKILVATYEKFLGCLSVGGPPRDLSDVCFVCDEVQLVGDKTRGQNVELLLTLLRRTGWRQLVCLSAVMSPRDADSLASWLGISVVRNPVREKGLTIRCYGPKSVHELTVARNTDSELGRKQSNITMSDQNDLVKILTKNNDNKPVIAFCMRLEDTYSFSRSLAAGLPANRLVSVPSGVEIDVSLVALLQKGVAFHNAELSEEERELVERYIEQGKVDVVYATTTLAAGVNFPLGSAAFMSWKRWNSDKKQRDPIGRAEFQNMAGRVGRMGQSATTGLVLLSASDNSELTQALSLMDLTQQDDLGRGISPEDFGSLLLQLFAGKICETRGDAFSVISSTLSASREISENKAGVTHWREKIDVEVDRLVATGCLLESKSKISVTSFGLAVARSGLKPETAVYFINGLLSVGTSLLALLPGDGRAGNEDDLCFVFAHAALSSPEFTYDGGAPTRTVGWRVSKPGVVRNPFATRLDSLLLNRPWQADPSAANGALLLANWSAGLPRTDVLSQVPGVRLGTIQGLARDAAWILTGVSEVIRAVTSSILAEESKPEPLRANPPGAELVRALSRSARRSALRISSGLPPDVLWLTSLDLPGQRKRLTRPEILKLRQSGMGRPQALMNGDADADEKRKAALSAPDNPGLANQVRDAARRWKAAERESARKVHEKRSTRAGMWNFIEPLYARTGVGLEAAFEEALACVAIRCEKLDLPGTRGRPDYLMHVEQFSPVVVEIKSKESSGDLVGLNGAMEVLAASEIIQMGRNFCVTLCSPGVDPSVAGEIENCKRLSVLEIADLAEAIIRIKEGTLSHADFYNWLTVPGIAQREDLPHPR